MLQKPLLAGLCCCAGIILWSVSLISVAETIIGWPCVVVWVFFCGVFLSVAEAIVGMPVLKSGCHCP